MDVINFVNHARQTLSVFGKNNDVHIQQLLVLLNRLSSDENRQKRSVITNVSDSKIDANVVLKAMDSQLELYETLLKSDDKTIVRNAKTNVTKTVHDAMIQLCKNKPFSQKSHSMYSFNSV